MEFLHLLRELVESKRRLEKHMSALTDAVTALNAAVAANTTAVNSVPNASDVAKAVKAIGDATAQLTTNNATLAGDLAPAT